jgi:nitrogen fixation/metabolism regulation signal transduction histidine kinase
MSLRMTLAEPRAALLRQAGHTAIMGLVWIMAATLAGVWLARKTAASLVKIREAARAVMLLPNAPRIDMNGYPIEFAELAATFNNMAARVEAATLERERLLSAAAEQLNAGTAALRRLNGRCPYA